MCGIIGSFSDKFSFSNKQIDIISHRGPDDYGYFFQNNVMLGHRRLSIVDLTANGHQPMQTVNENYTIVFNGEIYNHLEIRKELELLGVSFKSSSDTETLLYGYATWGIEILNKLNGIFAFAIYDKINDQLFVARDQFGVKPLYYYNQDGIFAFSSELKSLIQVDNFDDTIQIESLFYYLQTLYAPGVLTPFSSVQKLLPGHYLKVNTVNGFVEVHNYYKLRLSESKANKSELDYINELDEILNKALKRQLMSDVPIGFFLSGGLDSSLLVAIAKKNFKLKKIQCFTIATGKDMKNEGFSDDEYYARKVAEYLDVQLEVLPTNFFSKELFDKMTWHLDEPQADPAAMSVMHICEGARNMGIKVMIGGAAGDDLFSGYRRHQALILENIYQFIPFFIKKFLINIAFYFPSNIPFLRRIKKLVENLTLTKDQRISGYFMWIEENKILNLFTDSIKNKLDRTNLPMAYWEKIINKIPHGTSDLNKILFLEMSTFLPDHNLNYTDKMSMAVGVEARVPYLDLELVEFANKLPVKLKMQGKTTKYILRKVAERYLPVDVIYRPKTGFGAPVRQWIKNDFRKTLNDFTSESILIKKGILNPIAVNKLIEDDRIGKIDAAYTILSLLSIDSWLKQFLKN